MDEEEFQIHIQSQQSWQLMTCGQGRCPAGVSLPCLSLFLQFSGVAASNRLNNMHCVSCDHAQDNQS